MSTGENEQGLRRILDMTRMASLIMLAVEIYARAYPWFVQHQIEHAVSNKILEQLHAAGLFRVWWYGQGLSLLLLLISLLGVQGVKQPSGKMMPLVVGMGVGMVVFAAAPLALYQPAVTSGQVSAYTLLLLGGYLIILHCGTRMSRLLWRKLSNSVFNFESETFPQEERLLTNPYSINLPAQYQLKNKTRRSWINIINPFRGLLILGTPGSGKSFFIIEQVIQQHIEKGFAMFVYDFKYDDLTRLTYACLQRNRKAYEVPPAFYVINFDNLRESSRCNPLHPAHLAEITDATESSRTILLGLNKEWIHKQGDFFVESPINFLTAVIWFLRCHEGGKFCTLPHVIELMQAPYDQLFPVLNTLPEIEVLVNPFISAYQHDAMEQLEGQVASAKIGMARLSSPQLYWILSGHDFDLDINNPQAPKIVCMGNNPEKQQVYGAVLSLYISRLVRMVNKKGRMKCSLIFDEFPTIYLNHIDSLMATARSNLVATTLAVQDLAQLRKNYGKDQADVLMNLAGNVIAGQVIGETARQLSDRFGKILQERSGLSFHRTDTSLTQSAHLDAAIPQSTIATLSSGTFVGAVADDPGERIERKIFHAQIHRLANTKPFSHTNPHKSARVDVSPQLLLDNFHQIKTDIKNLLADQLLQLGRQ